MDAIRVIHKLRLQQWGSSLCMNLFQNLIFLLCNQSIHWVELKLLLLITIELLMRTQTMIKKSFFCIISKNLTFLMARIAPLCCLVKVIGAKLWCWSSSSGIIEEKIFWQIFKLDFWPQGGLKCILKNSFDGLTTKFKKTEFYKVIVRWLISLKILILVHIKWPFVECMADHDG